jgi:CelD/BcsL family acetyltransferase involved in cellulose biosynthesis
MKTLIALTILLASCAPVQERFFSDEEDAAYRELCERDGCITLTIPEWLKIMQRQKREPGRDV